ERGDRRGPREQAPAAEGTEAAALAGAASSIGAVTDMGNLQAPAANAVLESHTHQDAVRPADGQEGDERRERRSRDRYGRDRRERGDRAPREEGALAPDAVAVEGGAEVAVPAQPANERTERTRYPTGFVTDDAHTAAQAAPQAAAMPPPVAAPQAAPVAAGLPKVQTFQLPVDQLVQVAEGSGLQWVNSDAEKIAAVQAAIAAEPHVPRIPRERPAPIVIDEGPLVLVETRRDLRDMKLPFEQASQPLQ
ncbi:MAG: ribonuclease E/G, partial [Ramlibacter sp.]